MDNVNRTPDDWEAQLIDYSMGAMEPAEAAAFEARLEECRKHVQFARQYADVAGLLATAVQQVEPPDGHKVRLMARITATPQAPSDSDSIITDTATQPSTPSMPVLRERPPVEREVSTTPMPMPRMAEQPSRVTDLGEYRVGRNNSFIAALGIVAATLILFVGLWGWGANDAKQKAETQLAQLQTRQNAQAQRITELEGQLSTLAGKPNIPSGYKALNLAPQPEYATVSALAFYNPDKNDVIFVADGLQPLPQDKVYEFWLLKPQGQGNPDKGGTFTADPAGSVQHAATAPQPLAQYAGFAVTIEPAPGVDVATGPAVVVGTYPLIPPPHNLFHNSLLTTIVRSLPLHLLYGVQ